MAEQTVEDGSAAPAPGAVRRSVVLPAPVEAVWSAVTEAGHLSAWLGGEVELDPCPGGQIVVREDGHLRRGVIVDVEPLRHLEIQWLPASRRLGFLWGPDDEPAGAGGAVEFLLEEGPEGITLLTVIETPPVSGPTTRRSSASLPRGGSAPPGPPRCLTGRAEAGEGHRLLASMAVA